MRRARWRRVPGRRRRPAGRRGRRAPRWRRREAGAGGGRRCRRRPDTLRRLFTDVEPLARAAGHGPVLDAWGDDLLLLRGTAEPG
ncbi:hypothetical protein E1283_32835, partial [Streptomyces hainanensis]